VISTAQDNGISIGEVGRRTGLRASALRYYERAGLIRLQRRNAGHRVEPCLTRWQFRSAQTFALC
jgi:hypothetical protein